jgi:hypothetical protein
LGLDFQALVRIVREECRESESGGGTGMGIVSERNAVGKRLYMGSSMKLGE